MARLTKRDSSDKSDRLGDRATGEWFRKKGTRLIAERYDEATPSSEPAHWYLTDFGWHVFRDSDMKPVKTPKKKEIK